MQSDPYSRTPQHPGIPDDEFAGKQGIGSGNTVLPEAGEIPEGIAGVRAPVVRGVPCDLPGGAASVCRVQPAFP